MSEANANAPPMEHVRGVDYTRAAVLTPEVKAQIDLAFTYQQWDPQMIAHGNSVRDALRTAAYVIVANVPPSPDRTTALRKLRECRMDCNSAITFSGKF